HSTASLPVGRSSQGMLGSGGPCTVVCLAVWLMGRLVSQPGVRWRAAARPRCYSVVESAGQSNGRWSFPTPTLRSANGTLVHLNSGTTTPHNNLHRPSRDALALRSHGPSQLPTIFPSPS